MAAAALQKAALLEKANPLMLMTASCGCINDAAILFLKLRQEEELEKLQARLADDACRKEELRLILERRDRQDAEQETEEEELDETCRTPTTCLTPEAAFEGAVGDDDHEDDDNIDYNQNFGPVESFANPTYQDDLAFLNEPSNEFGKERVSSYPHEGAEDGNIGYEVGDFDHNVKKQPAHDGVNAVFHHVNEVGTHRPCAGDGQAHIDVSGVRSGVRVESERYRPSNAEVAASVQVEGIQLQLLSSANALPIPHARGAQTSSILSGKSVASQDKSVCTVTSVEFDSIQEPVGVEWESLQHVDPHMGTQWHVLRSYDSITDVGNVSTSLEHAQVRAPEAADEELDIALTLSGQGYSH